jgi:hypothetical protein
MPEATTMTNLQLQDDILKNLLLGLQKQSQFYVQKINESGELTEERKNFEKELSDINKVLTELSNKALSYTVQELDQLRTQFNNKLLELNAVITDLEINTLKIEFDSLTPEQKQFLKGEKGDKGDKGYSPFEFAKMFGFTGTESDYLLSLKGDKGETGTNGKDFTFDMFTPEQLQLLKGSDGQNGINGTNGKDFTFDMFTPEQLQLLKGADGQNGLNGKDFTYDMFTPEQLALLKGADGQNGLNGKDFTYDMFTPEQLALLKGADGQNGINGTNGKDFTFDMFTPTQLELIASLVTVDLSSILNRISHLESEIVMLGGSVTPPVVEPDYFYPKPYVSQITTNYETSPYTMTIDAGHYESEMLDLVEMQYVHHFIKTNISILSSLANVETNVTVVISDGLRENATTGKCIVYNQRFINQYSQESSGGAHYESGEYEAFPPEMAMTFASVENISDMLTVSLYTDPMIKSTFYQFLGTDKLFYKFNVSISSVEPFTFGENEILQYSELYGMIE